MTKKRRPAGVGPGVQQMLAHPGPAVPCGGRVWRLGFNTQDAKARLEELFRGHLLAGARRLGDPDEARAVRDDVLNGVYRTFQPGWLRTLNSPAGGDLFVLSLLQEHHPDATADDVLGLKAEAGDALEDALRVVVPDFFRALAAQWAAENRQPPDRAAELGEQIGREMTRLAASGRRGGPGTSSTS